jgi:CIC family chloride channel protein
MLAQSGMIALWPKLARQKGVLEVIKSVAVRGGYIPFRTTAFHFFAPAICMGSGGTVGPEGPAAQLGAGVASSFSRWFGLSDARRRIFTAAGAGAAIAAVFNTPLGGIFFALEIVLLNDFQTGTFSALVLASVTASVISRVFLGNQPKFHIGALDIGPYRHFFIYALLGIAAGFLALAFIRYSEWLHKFFQRWLRRWRQPLVMACVGLMVGIAGFFVHDIFGIGYEGINRLLRGEIVWYLALILLFLKFILVPMILESGGFGGVFAPSLFLGAMLGFSFAGAVNLASPYTGVAAPPVALILVGMGAVLAAVNSIPMAAIMILFEMTNNYGFILPLMLGVVCSTIVTHVTVKESIHSLKLRQAGYRMVGDREKTLLQSIPVAEVMRRDDIVVLPENLSLREVMKICIESPHECFYTKDGSNKLTGTITTSELRQIITEYENLRNSRWVAKDIAVPKVITVSEEDDLDAVMRLFGQGTAEEFPVMTAADPNRVVGTIWRQDVINAYNKESLKRNLTDGMARNLRTLRKTGHLSVAKSYSLLEKVAPSWFIGKTLAELKLRTNHGIEVLMIRKARDPFDENDDGEILLPEVNYKIQEGDTLMLFGENRRLVEAKKW